MAKRNMTALRNSLAGVAGALALSACSGGSTTMTDTGTTAETDAGMVMSGNDGGTCRALVGTPGTMIGRSLRNFTLEQCDGGPYEFYGSDFCSADHRLTVLSAAAGWCGPCREETRMLTEQIINRYEGQGVRVVQVMVDGVTTGEAPTASFCRSWIQTHNLVGAISVLDPSDELNRVFPDNALPTTILIDEYGTIRHRESGVSPELSTLRAAIDEILAE